MLMVPVDCIDDILRLAKAGCSDWSRLGHVDVKEHGALLLFNYTHQAQVLGRWNAFERLSRGLVVDRAAGEIVARPFDKFFNWLEKGRCTTAPIVSVTEKLDGSLGILYRRSGYRIATRGSLTGELAQWATRLLNTEYTLSGIDEGWTLLFEIIRPESVSVVSYGDTAELVLLAIRNRFTGDYLPFADVERIAEMCGFPVPKVFPFEDVSQIIKAQRSLDGDQEGWVAEFADGERYKFKGDRYLELHRLAASVSQKKVAEAMLGGAMDDLRSDTPDEFLEELGGYIRAVERTVTEKLSAIEDAFAAAPVVGGRKRFALWCKSNHEDLAPYLFAMLDGRDVRKMLLSGICSGRLTPKAE
jgi:RNA ligase